MPLTFSIITCTWNSERFLEQAIASVLAQDYPHIELVFVDGGSDDGTLERIRALTRPYVLVENVRGGISNAMNAGVLAATGDVIAHLHSDDYYAHSGVLSTVARRMEDSGKGWLFGRIARDVSGSIRSENFVAPTYSSQRLLRGNFVPHPATFVRRDLFSQAGYFDTTLKYAMDYDFWLKLADICEPFQMNEVLAVFREHAGSLSTSNRRAAMEEDFRVRISHAGRNPIALAAHYARFLVRRRRALSESV